MVKHLKDQDGNFKSLSRAKHGKLRQQTATAVDRKDGNTETKGSFTAPFSLHISQLKS